MTILPAQRPATGAERAALVLLALGETHGAAIWKEFDDAEIALLGDAIARLGTVEDRHVGAALSVFAQELSASAGFIGTSSAAEALLTKVLPEERASTVVERLRRPAGPGLWDRLAQLDDKAISGYLANEHPQTASIVLARMPAERSAAILVAMGRQAALPVLSRLANFTEADRDALIALEQTLSEGLLKPHARPKPLDPAIRIASMFDSIDQREATALIETWEREDAEQAGRVRALMFTFDDFVATSPVAIQVLLRGLDRDVLALALKGATDEIRARFLDQMSARAARMLEDQIASRGPVRRKDIAAAQGKVIAAARELERAGEIRLRPAPQGEAEDMVE